MRVFFSLVLLAVLASCSNAVPSRLFYRHLHQEPPPPPVSSERLRALRAGIIQQKLDNFDYTNTVRWEMRYLANSEHYREGGPFFIFVGGEWEISPGWIEGGHMYDMAREMNGYLFYTEHRFYGWSRPTSDTSTENLKYLTVEQALADLAHFIDVQKGTVSGAHNSGVILVGASYAASMVTWFRQRYPHKVSGVWASSAPLNAKVDFYEYKEVTAFAMELVGSRECTDRIQAAFYQMELEVAEGDTARVSAAFSLCSLLDHNNQLDVWNFFRAVSDEFAWIVQGHWPGDIEGVCAALTDPDIPDPVLALGRWVSNRVDPFCYDISHANLIEWYASPSWQNFSTTSGVRQWFFQTCNEFGWYQTSSGQDHVFGTKFPVDWYIEVCRGLFGAETFSLDNAAAVNAIHNGFNPNVTNTFSTHGEIDPWRPAGVQEDLNESSPTVILLGYSHCQDLFSIDPTWDNEQMIATKHRITATVRQWLGLSGK